MALYPENNYTDIVSKVAAAHEYDLRYAIEKGTDRCMPSLDIILGGAGESLLYNVYTTQRGI